MNHPSEKIIPVQRFYNQPSPVKAVLLAIADHHAHAGGARSHEFIHQLNLAVNVLEEVENIKAALNGALYALQVHRRASRAELEPTLEALMPEGVPNYDEMERRIKSALVTLNWR